MSLSESKNIERIRLKNSLVVPVLLLIIVWFIKFLEFFFDANFSTWGLIARNFNSIFSVFTSPLVHSDWKHLISNSLPVFLLCWCIFYFYNEIAFKIVIYSYLGSGLLLWLVSSRSGSHIGMSGLIYAFAVFVFLSGILRKYTKLIAISLIVVFLYGYLIWGIFPLDEEVSYEGHLSGAIMGIILAVIYRKHGPQRPIPSWEEEENETEEFDKNCSSP